MRSCSVVVGTWACCLFLKVILVIDLSLCFITFQITSGIHDVPVSLTCVINLYFHGDHTHINNNFQAAGGSHMQKKSTRFCPPQLWSTDNFMEENKKTCWQRGGPLRNSQLTHMSNRGVEQNPVPLAKKGQNVKKKQISTTALQDPSSPFIKHSQAFEPLQI